MIAAIMVIAMGVNVPSIVDVVQSMMGAGGVRVALGGT